MVPCLAAADSPSSSTRDRPCPRHSSLKATTKAKRQARAPDAAAGTMKE